MKWGKQPVRTIGQQLCQTWSWFHGPFAVVVCSRRMPSEWCPCSVSFPCKVTVFTLQAFKGAKNVITTFPHSFINFPISHALNLFTKSIAKIENEKWIPFLEGFIFSFDFWSIEYSFFFNPKGNWFNGCTQKKRTRLLISAALSPIPWSCHWCCTSYGVQLQKDSFRIDMPLHSLMLWMSFLRLSLYSSASVMLKSPRCCCPPLLPPFMVAPLPALPPLLLAGPAPPRRMKFLKVFGWI